MLKEKETNTVLEKLCQFEEENHLSNKMSRFRVYLAVELIYSTGMRINEVASLVLSDINFQNRTVIVREGKGGRSRTAWLNDYTTDILEFYIKHLRSLMLADHQLKTNSLFGIGKDFLSHLVNKFLGKIAEQTGLPPITAHSFRHILGYHLLRAGCNIRYIQEILGHKLLRNTEIYSKVEKEDLKDVLDTYHPRKFKRLRNEKIIA